jgi:hypothetical protein
MAAALFALAAKVAEKVVVATSYRPASAVLSFNLKKLLPSLVIRADERRRVTAIRQS